MEFGHSDVIQALEVALVFNVVNLKGGQFVGVASCSRMVVASLGVLQPFVRF